MQLADCKLGDVVSSGYHKNFIVRGLNLMNGHVYISGREDKRHLTLTNRIMDEWETAQ